MRIYASNGDPTFIGSWFPAKRTPCPMEIATMTRRSLSLLVLAITSVVLAACSQTTAPGHSGATTTTTCLSGFEIGSGYCQ